MRYNNKNVILPEPWVQPRPADDEIWYTSNIGVISPYNPSDVPTIISNAYDTVKQVYIMKFAQDLITIGDNGAFRDSKFIKVFLPNKLTTIGAYAFQNTLWMTTITIGKNVNLIKKYAFRESSRNVLNTINFMGTIAQYNAINKEVGWNDGVPAKVVHCTDGDAPI